MRIGDLTELDAQQLIANRHRELARFAVADGDIELLGLETADRGDDRRGAAGEDLGDLAGLDVVEQLVQAIIVSTTSWPSSSSSWIIERRVTPGRMLPVRLGVSTWPSLYTTIMFMPPSSSR